MENRDAQVTAGDYRFKEIEHKFVVSDNFDVQHFRNAMEALGPTRTNALRVQDRYYLTAGGIERKFLIRHRFDSDMHHLTVKSVGTDTEVRDEVNLDLGQHAGDQAERVDAFVAWLDVRWTGTVVKDIEVWYFADCEVVHYVASADGRSIRCVEFEATKKDSLDAALATVERFERATGFHGRVRADLSLPQLLFPELAVHLAP